MFCRKCGNEIPDDSEFCYKCGAPVAAEKQVGDSKLWDYTNAVKKLDKAQTAKEFEELEAVFERLGDYKDSAEKLRQCKENKIPVLYEKAVEAVNSATSAKDLQKAVESLKLLNGYKNSNDLLKQCENDLKLFNYNDAYKMLQTADTSEGCTMAWEMFAALGDFEDAPRLAAECENKYSELVCKEANELLTKNASPQELSQFITRLKNLGENEETHKSIEGIKDKFSETIYNSAVEKLQSVQNNPSAEGYREAAKLFGSVADEKNSTELADICDYNAKAIKLNMIINELQAAYDEYSIDKCMREFLEIEDFEKTDEMVKECKKQALGISRLNELKKLLLTLECSNDIDALNEAKRKALDMKGIGNSTQIARECERKIACINSGEKFVPSVRSASIVRDDLLDLKAGLKLVTFEDDRYAVKLPSVLCRKCKKEIPEGSDFCPICGTNLKIKQDENFEFDFTPPPPPKQKTPPQEIPINKPQKIYCPNCGAQVHEQSLNCTNCGMKLKTTFPPKKEKTVISFSGIAGIIYFIVMAVVVLSLFVSGNCVCYEGDLYYSDDALKTFIGMFLGSTIVLAFANIIYTNYKGGKDN